MVLIFYVDDCLMFNNSKDKIDDVSIFKDIILWRAQQISWN